MFYLLAPFVHLLTSVTHFSAAVACLTLAHVYCMHDAVNGRTRCFWGFRSHQDRNTEEKVATLSYNPTCQWWLVEFQGKCLLFVILLNYSFCMLHSLSDQINDNRKGLELWNQSSTSAWEIPNCNINCIPLIKYSIYVLPGVLSTLFFIYKSFPPEWRVSFGQ